MLRGVLFSLLAGTMAAPLGCGPLVRVADEFALTAPWQDYARVVIRTCNGRVELAGAGTEEIEISGTKRAGGLTLGEARRNLEQLELVAEPDAARPDTFRIELRYPEHLRYKSIGASLSVRLPRPCAAEIATGNGSISVAQLADEVVLRSSNGALSVRDVAGDVRGRTSNGRVTAEEVSGDAKLRSSNGPISVRAIGGDCTLETSNGWIRVQDARGSISATTSNGRIRVRASPPEEGSVVLRTSNGSIHATLPATMRAALDISAGNGEVRTVMKRIALSDLRFSRSRLEALMNGGGGEIRARTSNGSITLVWQ